MRQQRSRRDIYKNGCKSESFLVIVYSFANSWLACSIRVWMPMVWFPSLVKLKTSKLVFAASQLSTQHLREKAKNDRPRIMFPGKVACIPVACCFHELACERTRLSVSVYYKERFINHHSWTCFYPEYAWNICRLMLSNIKSISCAMPSYINVYPFCCQNITW